MRNLKTEHYSGDLLDWSEESCRILGLDPDKDEITIDTFMRLVHPDDLELVMSTREYLMSDREEFAIDCRIILPGGEIRHIQGRDEVVRDDAGQPVRCFGTAQDITEHIQAGQALN